MPLPPPHELTAKLPCSATATKTAFVYKFCNGEPIPMIGTATVTVSGDVSDGNCATLQPAASAAAYNAAYATAELLRDAYTCPPVE